ncbi:protein Cep78 homolog [Anthonomus grandis grandis]|uniref:protein Cep78 homolog n=1 Tax=Anthonomus grandis grandis TaxID=2921223 RepID=UPI002165E63D|nr:protein Cep78 homolog [Anthonomus grandis grandis]
MDKPKSSVINKQNNPKPVNVFYVWYTELCRRLNITPAPSVKPAKPKCQTVLDFVADRLKIEEWPPVLNALRQDTSLHVVAIRSRIGNCQFLHEIDTEEKARGAKRKYGCIWTAYVLKQLLKSISNSLRSTQVLTYLELDGLPLFMQYLEPLLQALKRNKTLKTLSFSNCSIQDQGCQLVCSYLRFTPNIEVLNLSGCNLSPVSGEHLAKLIKYQQINRYCESWHSSLRYENPDAGKMRGIKRITINCNQYFGDAGLNFILDELEDDLWVKALDMQKCGFTENVSNRIIDIVEYNKTIEIIDLRQNDLLNMATVEKVFQILKNRQFGVQPEFQWCATAVTLTWSSVYSSTSKSSLATTAHMIHKTRSAPMKTASSKASAVTWDPAVKKTRTLDSFQRGTQKFGNLNETKQQVLELNDKLQKEIQRRKVIEKKNEQLQQQLNSIKTSSNVSSMRSTTVKRFSLSADRSNVRLNGVNKEIIPNKRVEMKKPLIQAPILVRRKHSKNPEADKAPPKVLKNGFYKNNLSNGSNVYNILEQLLNTGQPIERNVEEEFMNYLNNHSRDKSIPIETQHARDPGGDPEISNSQVSLYRYMEELKNDKK